MEAQYEALGHLVTRGSVGDPINHEGGFVKFSSPSYVLTRIIHK